MAKNETAVKDMAEIGAASAASENKAREAKTDAQGRAYGTGRRKESVARVWVKRGKGKIIVNGKPQEQYFGRQTHLLVLNQPFLVANRVGEFDVECTVVGGGLSGQAAHGISRALDNFEPARHGSLKKAGFLTRDARQVERKKVGRHKARRSKQWAKR